MIYQKMKRLLSRLLQLVKIRLSLWKDIFYFHKLTIKYNASIHTDNDIEKMQYTLLRENHTIEKGGEQMLKMIELPYPLTALEPYYSKETLDLHYNILYKGYVDNTNNTEEKLRVVREKRDFSNIKCLEKDLSFYGSGAILHELFFENMGPAIPTEPDIELMKQMIKDFGSYEIFKEQFIEASKTVEASRLVFVSMGP